MKTTAQEIVESIKKPEKSMSEGRRMIHEGAFKLNGEQLLSMGQEVEVKDGDILTCGKKQQWIRIDGKWHKDSPRMSDEVSVPGRLWASNMTQFPRLLAEIVATQELDLEALADEMDLSVSEVESLFERAQTEWEIIKKSLDTRR